jgi:replicative DNA helicase
VSIAKKRKCAVMIIAHLRKRGKNDKRNYTPSIDDISGSGSFKQDSTEVLVTTREIDENDEDKIKYTDKGKLFVLKNKSGPNGVIRLYFSDRKAKISSDEIGETDKTIRDIFGVVPS